MAEVAVPIDGGERPVDVLSLARRVVVVAAALVGVACGDARTPDGASAAEGARGEMAALPAASEQALLDAIGERLAAAGERERPAAPSWPDDLRFHPRTRVESIEILAVLEDEEGRPYSFTRRFDRVSLRGIGGPSSVGEPAADGPPVDASDARSPPVEDSRPATGFGGDDFAFDAVVRLSGGTQIGSAGSGPAGEGAADETDGAGRTLHSRSAIERVTLGLAVADEHELAVRDARVERAVPSLDAADACAFEQRLVDGDSVALRFAATACPAGALLGPLALATSPTLAVDGTLRVEGESRAVVGRGWTRRVWGEASPSGGAVLFDRLLLDIDGLGLIEAERSKRRSGRGPRVTTARLRRGAGSESVSAEWNDVATADEGGAADGTAEVPSAWHLAIESLGIDLTLVAPAGGQAGRATGQLAWRGAVRAEGSHEGVGFVEFTPLEPPVANEEVRS